MKAAEANANAAKETLAEMEARLEAGEPVNEHTLAMAQQAVDHTNEQEVEAIVEKAKTNASADLDYEGVVAGESKIMAEQKAVTH